MFSSPKNFIIGASAIAAGGLLIVASGGALAPVMVAAGIAGGGIQLAKSIYKAAGATTDNEARQAWQGIGAGTIAIAGSVAGAKGALKKAGINTEGMNCIQAAAKCITSTPSQVGKTAATFTSGQVINNLKIQNNNKKKIKAEADDNKPLKPENKNLEAEPKPEQNVKTKSECEIKPEQKAKQPKTQQTETNKFQIQEPETEIKQDVSPKQPQVTESPQPEKTPETNVAQQTKAVNNTKTIVKKDGSKITLEYDENGLIQKSTIKKTDGTIINKNYKDGKLIDFVSHKRMNELKASEYKYSADGKISEINLYDNCNETVKTFKYNNDGQYIGHELKTFDQIQTFDSKGKLLNKKILEASSEEIAEVVRNLDKPCELSKINDKTVVRKVQVLNKITGQPENMYITTQDNNHYSIVSSDGTSYGCMTIKDSSDFMNHAGFSNNCPKNYKTGDFIELYKLETKNNGVAASQYKGLGTELVKQAVLESHHRGYNGRIALEAANYKAGGTSESLAENFYLKIGLSNSNTGATNRFIIPEHCIAEFLKK